MRPLVQSIRYDSESCLREDSLKESLIQSRDKTNDLFLKGFQKTAIIIIGKIVLGEKYVRNLFLNSYSKKSIKTIFLNLKITI
jgi:hypothetical protein